MNDVSFYLFSSFMFFGATLHFYVYRSYVLTFRGLRFPIVMVEEMFFA